MKYRIFFLCLSLSLLLCFSFSASSEVLSLEEMEQASDVEQIDIPLEELSSVVLSEAMKAGSSDLNSVREDWINEMIALSQQLYRKANGKPQRAHYSGDIYVCKNYTVNLFRETCTRYRMAEFPNVPLIIPNNKSKDDCLPYNYGIAWEDVPAEDGNPFYVAASFLYDETLSKEENGALATDFMKQVKKGDFFQMSADYYYGKGAHSLIFIADYDPDTDTVHWTDSNMKGTTQNGERYAYVQFDAEKDIEWFVDAFCHKKRGATLYRLRNDIILADE